MQQYTGTQDYDAQLKGRLGNIQDFQSQQGVLDQQIAAQQNANAQAAAAQKVADQQAKAQADFQKAQQAQMAALSKQQAAQAASQQKALEDMIKKARTEVAYNTSDKSNAKLSEQILPASKTSGSFMKFMKAISGQESGGSYSVVNHSSGALGKYQIMPGNVAVWTKQALGHSLSPSQFLHSPQAQEATAQYVLSGYFKKYGAAGAAVAWYAGPGTAAKYVRNPSAYNRPQGNYPSINAYALSVLRRMQSE